MAKNNPEAFDDYFSDLIDIPNFKSGICNRVPLKNIPIDGLLDALNVDIDANGKIRTRKGFIKSASGNYASCYDHQGTAYAVKDGSFGRINKDLSFTPLLSGVDQYVQMFYTAVNTELYFSNGIINGKVDIHGNLTNWSVESPQNQPVVSVNSNGTMKKGRYLVAYTYVYSNGYESGASPFAIIEVANDNFSLDVTCSIANGATDTNIYISEVNGSELYFAKNGLVANLNTLDNSGNLLQDELMQAFPPCTFVTLFRGAIYGVVGGNRIIYTNQNDYGRYNPSKHTLFIDGTEIAVFQAVNNGLYVATANNTYFIGGKDEDKFEINSVLPHGAIKGTQYSDLDAQVFGWLSTNGHISADNDGNVKNTTINNFIFPENYGYGISFIRKEDGIKQVIFDLKQNGSDSPFETNDYIEEKEI